MQEIIAKFNMPAMKMMGGAAAEEKRKATRGTLNAKLSGQTTDQEDCYLEFWHTEGGFKDLAGAIGIGRYAFVRMLDLSIRVWPIVNSGDTFHAGLSSFAPRVYYAGELEIDADNKIVSWNNRSGQYIPDVTLAAQAALPMSKFVEHKGPM